MSRASALRPITIDNVNYVWRVRSLGPQAIQLSVWLAQKSRSNQELRVRVRFDDPWLNYGPIITAPPERVREVFVLEPLTPARVRQIILAALQASWNPSDGGLPLAFEWANDATLRPIPIVHT
jgi:hypothetical protein